MGNLVNAFNKRSFWDWWHSLQRVNVGTDYGNWDYIKANPHTKTGRFSKTLDKDQIQRMIRSLVKDVENRPDYDPTQPITLYFYRGSKLLEQQTRTQIESILSTMDGYNDGRIRISPRLMDHPEPWAGPIRKLTHSWAKAQETSELNKMTAQSTRENRKHEMRFG